MLNAELKYKNLKEEHELLWDLYKDYKATYHMQEEELKAFRDFDDKIVDIYLQALGCGSAEKAEAFDRLMAQIFDAQIELTNRKLESLSKG